LNITLDEIRQKLSAIRYKGFVRSLRKGPTGIGYTLETLLEIKENNISAPDFGNIELKAQRENHNGMTTLFTFNKKAWIMNPLDAIREYGSFDANGRKGMYYTMGMTPNSAGLFLYVDNTSVSVRHISGRIVAVWMLEEIKKRFEAKVQNVLLVKAKVEERAGIEYFLFDRARLLTGGTSVSILKHQFENEKLIVDLRLHDKITSARNHGTGFRVFESNIESLYGEIVEIPF